ncbi:MAG: hypothetical protein INH13_25750 [Cupriavidus sp.]|nr:hypothetical protein [Cupriavidus sp.]
MEINITRFFNESDPFQCSASAAELGPDAGRITWRNAMSSDFKLLDTEEKLDAFRDHMRGFGAWDEAEIAAWSAQECEALFAQLVAGDMRESGLADDFPDEIDWAAYEAGDHGCNIFRDIDGEIYYYLGS